MALDPWPLTTLQARHFIFQDKPLSLAVKNLPAIQEIHILSLRNPLEEEMATYSSILARKSHGLSNPVGYSPWGHKYTDKTEATEHA